MLPCYKWSCMRYSTLLTQFAIHTDLLMRGHAVHISRFECLMQSGRHILPVSASTTSAVLHDPVSRDLGLAVGHE
jgi:hypothetical protein